MDPNAVGGAVLLGLRGVAVVAHGSSSPEGIANAIRLADRAVRERAVERTAESLAASGATREALRETPAPTASAIMAAMDRDEVMKLVRDHLVTELEVEPGARSSPRRGSARTSTPTRSTSTSCVMELEDRYGIRVSEEEAAEIETVGRRRRVRLRAAPAAVGEEERESSMTPASASLAELFADAPEELRRQALSHSSWVERRNDAYGRLAFLGDSVLGPRRRLGAVQAASPRPTSAS